MKNGKQNIVHNKVIQQQESQRPLPLAFIKSHRATNNMKKFDCHEHWIRTLNVILPRNFNMTIKTWKIV